MCVYTSTWKIRSPTSYESLLHWETNLNNSVYGASSPKREFLFNMKTTRLRSYVGVCCYRPVPRLIAVSQSERRQRRNRCRFVMLRPCPAGNGMLPRAVTVTKGLVQVHGLEVVHERVKITR